MNRWLAVVVLVMLVLTCAVGLRNTVAAKAAPVVLANGGAPVPPSPWLNGGAPVPPSPWSW